MQQLNFLLVRKAQLVREFKALGLFYSLLLITGMISFLFFFYKYQVTTNNALFSASFSTLVIFIIHISRKDHNFIYRVSLNPSLIFITEYFALLFPFLILSIAGISYPVFLISFSGAVLISFIPVKSRTFFSTGIVSRLLPKTNFEWKSGTRKTGILTALIYIASLALVAIPFASIIALWFLLLVTASFYDQGESREMIEAYELNAKKFLITKFKQQIILFMIPAFPILLISFLFFPDRWWFYLLFLVFAVMNIAVFVFTKYAVWRSSEINRSGSIVNTMCMLGLFLPFFLPLPIFVIIKNYRKSINNLNPLLHDYN